MRIVQVLLDQRIGGAERLAATLASEWRQQGDSTRIVHLDPVAGASTQPLARLSRLRRALRGRGDDLVVAHSALPNLYARLAAPFGTPVASVLHSAQDDFIEPSLRVAEHLLHRRGTVVAVSEDQLSIYRRRFPRARIQQISNGVTPGLPRRTARARIPGPLRVVTISRVAEQKRPELWQRIAREVAAVPLSIEWYGPAIDDAAVALVQAHASSGAPGRFMGPTDAVGDVLASSDVLLHTASREASSIGLLEAAAVGLPIICAATVTRTLPAGLPWHVFDDATEAAEALVRIAEDFAPAEAHAEQWREEIRLTASASRCAAAYRALAAR